MNKKEICFTKMHGCMNDYIYIDCTKEALSDPASLSVRLSDRRTGIGGDGIILILPSDIADFRMRIFNADGSEAEMCGNGLRCVGKFVYDKGLTKKTVLTIETGVHGENASKEERLPSVKTLTLISEEGKVVRAVADMGLPLLSPSLIPVNLPGESVINETILVDGSPYAITCVNMGNPHAVTFLSEIDSLDLPKIGPLFEHHEVFPSRTNTEFIKVLNPKELSMRVWERGSGETFACGTGAAAAAYAAILNGLAEDAVTVHLLGGDLKISYDKETGHLFMDGPCTTVFEGKVEV